MRDYEIEPVFSVGPQSPYSAPGKLYDVPGTRPMPTSPAVPEIPDDLLSELLGDLEKKPSKPAKKSNSLSSKAALAKENAKLLKERAMLAKEQMGKRVGDAFKKPGMMTGRAPTLRGLGGGLVDMFFYPALNDVQAQRGKQYDPKEHGG